MPQPLVISKSALWYVKSKISATVSGAAVDPTGDTAKMALMAGSDSPTSSDLKSASWETDTTTSPTTYKARVLVGPSGVITPTAGTYMLWVQITDSPEIPLIPCGIVVVTD
jgi:hypothetical protein